MSRGKILIVDDDPDILTLVSHILSGEDYETATVSRGSDVFEKILQFSPDIVILDLLLPDMDGEKVLEGLKGGELTRNIPVLILSGVNVPEHIRRCLSRGAEEYIVKPFHPEVLIGHIDKVSARLNHEEKVQSIIERYLGAGVAKMVVEKPELIRLTGVRRPIVSMFVDIRGFTTIVELMEPEDVVKLLNLIFGELSLAIFNMGGTIDKYMGDGLMAFWGAPIANENMETLAVESALLMMEKMRSFNSERRYPGALEIQIGIGVSFGNAVVGNIGSEKRTDYTAIGESVNVASRLEKIAKPGQILITESMYEKVKDNFTCVSVGELSLKGKTLPVKVFEVIS